VHCDAQAYPSRSHRGSDARVPRVRSYRRRGAARATSTVLLAAVLGASGHPLSAQRRSSDRDSGPVAIAVMTFNIRTSEGRDGDNVWPNRKELVAETIRRFDPDVFGLQEALADQIGFLESALEGYRWVGVDRGLNGGTGLSEATPIFYRYRELAPIETGTFWLSDAPNRPRRGRRASRIVTWARFHHLASGRQLLVYNTHFTLRRGPRQVRSAEQIREHIAGFPEGSAVVVMGDFNAVAETSDTWSAATSDGLRDAWIEATERRGPPLTSSGFGPPPDGWEGRIDWILVGGPIGVSEAETVVHSENGRYPSDHYPVGARLVIGR
jgi:endonuclease/exonuclease/phosphatase family metal-dependent hydrolase